MVRKLLAAGAVALSLAATAASANARVAVQPSASATHSFAAAPACHRGYYKNASGRCVRRPVHSAKPPAGATAKCRDGTYSSSQHASGTCSHHGGVLRWIHHP